MQASAVALVGNVALLAAKGLAAVASGSSAIYADAGNSASDVAYSLLMGLGLWFSLRPPDDSHPHGHRRVESLVSVAIGGMMAYAAWEAFQGGLRSWQSGQAPTLTALAVAVPVAAGGAKGGMYLIVRRLAQKASSPALAASASDNLADIVSSALALIGYLGGNLLNPVLDPLAAFAVTAWIVRAAARVLWDGLQQLVGGAASPALRDAAIAAALSVPGVVGVDRVLLQHDGPVIDVDIHIRMAADAPLLDVHRASHSVRERIEALDGVEHAYVHVEPAQE